MKRDSSISRLGQLLVAAAVFTLLMLSTGSNARAAGLVVVSSSPTDGATVAVSPPSVTITFNQSIGSAVTMVVNCNGVAVGVPAAKPSPDQLSMVLDLSATPLPAGNCTLDWGAQGLDGASVSSGTLSFKVQQGIAVTATTALTAVPTQTTVAATTDTATANPVPTNAPAVDGPLFFVRVLASIGLAMLFGALALIAVAWPEGVEYILSIRFIRSAWIMAFAASVGVVVCLTAKVTGVSISSGLNPKSWTDLTDTVPGKAALLGMLLAGASGWVAIRPERAIDPQTQLPALAIPGLAVATLGLSRAGGSLEFLGFAAGIVHALAMAVWFGGLVLLARVVLSGPGQEDLVHATRGFSRLARPALILTVITGAVQMYRMDSGHLFTGHGKVLILKVLAVIAVVFVGEATRQFTRQRLGRVDVLTSAMAARLRRAVGMEAAAGAFILLLTGWMLTLQPGNIAASGNGPSNYAVSHHFVDGKGANEVLVYLTPSRIGLNAVYLSLLQPTTAISSFTVRFDPPAGSVANAIMLTPGLVEAGTASLPLVEGLPFGDSGTWTMTVSVISATGEFTDSTPFTVLLADGTQEPVETVITAALPVVTAPQSPPTLGASVTTTPTTSTTVP